jgi:hypothetical protein
LLAAAPAPASGCARAGIRAIVSGLNRRRNCYRRATVNTDKPRFHSLIAVALVTGALCLTVPSPSTARDIGDVSFADVVDSEGASLRLIGLGTVYYMRFWEVYVGGLYLPADVDAESGEVLGRVPKRLEFRYSRKLRADQLTAAADEFLERNLAPDLISRLRASIEAINSLYVDVGEGDRYALTYLPGEGTSLDLNGRRLGTVEGDEFAAAYYSIWLGDKPISSDFKAALLGDT